MGFDEEFWFDIWHTLEGSFRTKLSDDTREIWKRGLEHLPRKSVFSAVSRLTREQDKMPSLAQLLRYTREDLAPVHVPNHKEGFDSKGVPCWYFEDEPNKPCYKAEDCPEGRAFLEAFRKFKAPEQAVDATKHY